MKIHILAIAGVMTAPLAVELQNQGHQVSGSDQQQIYPPISTILETAHLPINKTAIDSTIDLAIIGSGFQKFKQCQDEFQQIKNQKIPFISATEYLAQNIIKRDSILVAGSFGKTTITSLIYWIFRHCQISPSYFFGGQLIADLPSLKMAKSNWSIIEADESINGLDYQAKFLYYPVKYLVLTSTHWEHKESYLSPADNLLAFKKLIQKLPEDGALIYNSSDPQIDQLLPFCRAPKIPYKNETIFETKLIGKHNLENISAASALCNYLHLNPSDILEAIKTYPGIKRRLEVIDTKNNITFIDDFAQDPARVKAAIDAVSFSYPNRPIHVYFEPHASFLQNINSLQDFKTVFDNCQQVILSKINFSSRQDKQLRVSATNWQQIVGEKLTYLPLDQTIVDFFSKNLQPNDILLHFSSGGLLGINNLNLIIKSFSNI